MCVLLIGDIYEHLLHIIIESNIEALNSVVKNDINVYMEPLKFLEHYDIFRVQRIYDKILLCSPLLHS